MSKKVCGVPVAELNGVIGVTKKVVAREFGLQVCDMPVIQVDPRLDIVARREGRIPSHEIIQAGFEGDMQVFEVGISTSFVVRVSERWQKKAKIEGKENKYAALFGGREKVRGAITHLSIIAITSQALSVGDEIPELAKQVFAEVGKYPVK